jgi:hypothetical protein
MKIRAFVFLMTFILLACSEEKRTPPPKKWMPPAKMKSFLMDLHELEAGLLTSGIRQDSAQALFELHQKKLYRKHGVDSAQVMQSLQYYTKETHLLDSLYTSMGGRMPAAKNP